mgnify:CR=1 FL=1
MDWRDHSPLPWHAIDPYPESFYKRYRIHWTALGWTRKQWKRSKMWKKAGVTEEKMGRLRNLDHDFLQEMKDGATAEALVEQMFGKAGD